MNILVKNGNFGNVSIGERLVIPTALSAAVAAYGSLSRTQTRALINLYDTLRTAGLWAKLKKLYIPVIAPTLGKTHVNVLTGDVDWIPTEEFQLTANGLTEVGDQPTYTGGTISVDSQSLANITSFAYISKSLVSGAGGAKCSFGLNLSSANDRSLLLYSQYQPDVNMWINSSSMTIRTSITDSTSGDYTLIAAVVDTDYTSVHKGAFGQWIDDTNNQSVTFDRIVPYSNMGSVGLGGTLKISGLATAITEAQYNTMLSAFGTFSAAIS